MKKLTCLLMVASIPALTSCLGSSEQSSSSTSSSESSEMYWPQSSLPLSFKVSTGFGDNLNTIKDTVNMWSEQSGKDFFSLTNTSNKSHPSMDDYYDSVNGLYIVDEEDWDGNASALAITVSYAVRSGGDLLLTQSDILLNTSYDFYYDPADATGDDYHAPSVILHEAGHVLGSDHINEEGAVMYPYLGTTDVYTELGVPDLERIADLYNITSSPYYDSIKKKKTGGNSALIAAIEGIKEGEEVRVVHELRVDHDCYHYINDTFVGKHHYEIKQVVNHKYNNN